MHSTKPVPRVRFAAFAMSHLEMDLYYWQIKILAALEKYRVSALVCNGGGKSSRVIPAAVLGFLYNWPSGRVKVTSGSFDQVENVVWPAIEKYQHLPFFKGWTWLHCRIDTPQKGFAVGFSTDKATNLEGMHEDLDSPLLYIVDEAKAIEDDKFDHIGRCSPTFYLQTSSAGPAEGFFYHSFNKFKQAFWTIRVCSHDCPHVTDAQRAVDRVVLDRAEYAMKHESEFSEDLSGAAIRMAVINQALQRQMTMTHNHGARVAFCDFALSGAENVLALRDGNKVFLIAHWRETDTVQACRTFIDHFKRLKLHPSEIFGDAGGPGQVMIHVLKDMGWPIVEVNNGVPAEDAEHYANRGSEIWFKAAREIEFGVNGQHVIIPDDKTFIEQATSRKRERDAKLRLKIESKETLIPRVGSSPDRADAVFGAMVCRPSQWNPQTVVQAYIPPNMFKPDFVTWS